MLHLHAHLIILTWLLAQQLILMVCSDLYPSKHSFVLLSMQVEQGESPFTELQSLLNENDFDGNLLAGGAVLAQKACILRMSDQPYHHIDPPFHCLLMECGSPAFLSVIGIIAWRLFEFPFPNDF